MKLEVRGGDTVEPSGGRFVIGRDKACDLALDDPEVSHEHAVIRELPDGRFEIRDLGSSNGTFVNGKRISEPTPLKGGEEIKIGTAVLRALGSGAAETVLARREETKLAKRAGLRLEVRGGDTVEPSGGRFVIGRDKACDLALDDPEVSHEHAVIRELPDGRFEIRDLGSSNGTFVNGKRISEPTPLKGGQEIKIGTAVLRALGSGAAETVLARREEAVIAAPPTPLGTPPTPLGTPPTPSGVRQAMQRSVNRATVIAIGASAVAVIAVVLAVAGVFSSDDNAASESEVINGTKPSTLQVVTRDQGRLVGGGSAWVYDADQGLIVTNAHVINNGARFQAGFDSTSLKGASVVGVAPCDDLAVLRVSPAGLETLPIASESDIQQGDTIYVLGYPGNSTSQIDFLKSNFQVTKGTISALDVRVREGFTGGDNGAQLLPDAIQTDAAQNPGNSGGPWVNGDQELVGVAVAGSSATEGQGTAISVNRVNEVVPQLANGESIGWAGFGVAALPSRVPSAESGPFTAANVGAGGMLVTAVVRDTPADQAGLPSGVLILAINHQRVTTQQQYCSIVRNIQSGEDVLMDLADLRTGRTVPGVRITFP